MCMWCYKKNSVALGLSVDRFHAPINGYSDVIRLRQHAPTSCDSKPRTKHTVVPPIL
ncbi:hypothetical protein GHT06_015203 [Daphnia sinensis]|uniref:Uncharacterized protein n=1 Tax=Daphnia sinensis TaxID=1820382 RepID=A0AAD5PSP9_9CRUS|nr:hypothetical protein GHT06_015203 [Daphnia sinensis]